MSEVFVVTGLGGKRTLKGTIAVRGAKNAALKMLAASVLFDGSVRYANIPEIEDVHRMVDLLRASGVGATKKTIGTLTLTIPKKLKGTMDAEIAKRFRASIVLSGPLLARTGKVIFPHPGGCVIGERPIDLFMQGFEAMGANITIQKKNFVITSPKNGLQGTSIFFRTQTVTGTETFMMAAVLAKGKTTLGNAAMEPEIIALAKWLNSCGARISGAGTPTIVIEGTGLLAGNTTCVVPPDRIETGSFLVLGALAAKELRIINCEASQVESVIETLRTSGVRIEVSNEGKTIIVKEPAKGTVLRGVSIKTHEYPGFPTDAQAPMMVYLTQVTGESTVFETIFEGRLAYTESLVRMGADIKMMDTQRVLVKGPNALRGRVLESPDLRAGLAYLFAAIIASGESVVHHVYYIDRGYEAVEERLRAIGVNIRRSSI